MLRLKMDAGTESYESIINVFHILKNFSIVWVHLEVSVESRRQCLKLDSEYYYQNMNSFMAMRP